MEPEKKMARDLAILSVVLLAGMLVLLSNLGFQQDWVVESRDGMAMRPDKIAFLPGGRRREPAVILVTPCQRYDGRYSRLLGKLTVDRLDRSFQPCVDGDATIVGDLAQLRGYRFEGEKLRLETTAGHVLMLVHPARITAN